MTKRPKKWSLPRRTASVDTECYQSYWSIGFKDTESNRSVILEKYEGHPLDVGRLRNLLKKWRIVTFNGEKYDLPMICYAMSGASNAELKKASDELVDNDPRNPLFRKHWLFYERYDIGVPAYIDMIDWMQVSPGSPQMPSLKAYAGRLHRDRMMDLPFVPDSWIRPEDHQVMRDYLGYDLDDTEGGYLELKPQIDLRAEMSDEYGVDLRSKSDAQVAEAVIKAKVRAITNKWIPKPKIDRTGFYFDPPEFIKFKTPVLQELFEKVCATEFQIDYDGDVITPVWMSKKDGEGGGVFTVGLSNYKLGIGGLHSQEKSRSWLSDAKYKLVDRDVTSYYPTTIIKTGLYPEAIGPLFIKIFIEIYDKRLWHKAQSQRKDLSKEQVRYHADRAETLKIVLNGLFGKFGSQYACVYSPKLLIQTTMIGQFAILMAIEDAELHGFNVVSANTDGFVTRVERARESTFDALMLDWELATGYNTEETRIKSLHSRDVNNYFAITLEKDGGMKIKAKGAFGPSGPGQKGAAGMKKNVDCTISNDAVIEYLKRGQPIEDTVRSCDDIRLFITQRKVKGGAEKDGEYIGKNIRFYYAKGVEGVINYVESGNKVPSSDGAKECMKMPKSLPDDVDHDWYIRESYAILDDIGMPSRDPALYGRRGHAIARFDDQKTFHMVMLPSGVAECGKMRKSIRELLTEEPAGSGVKICKKCQVAHAALEL